MDDLVETAVAFRDSANPKRVMVEINSRLNALLGKSLFLMASTQWADGW